MSGKRPLLFRPREQTENGTTPPPPSKKYNENLSQERFRHDHGVRRFSSPGRTRAKAPSALGVLGEGAERRDLFGRIFLVIDGIALVVELLRQRTAPFLKGVSEWDEEGNKNRTKHLLGVARASRRCLQTDLYVFIYILLTNSSVWTACDFDRNGADETSLLPGFPVSRHVRFGCSQPIINVTVLRIMRLKACNLE